MNEQRTDARGEGADGKEEAPQPQPEHGEPKIAEPTPGDLSKRDYFAILIRAGKESIKDHIPNLAAALAYYAFLAIPSLLLVAVGVFGLVADRDAITEIMDRLQGVAPQEALDAPRGQPGARHGTAVELGPRDDHRRHGARALDAHRLDADADVGAELRL